MNLRIGFCPGCGSNDLIDLDVKDGIQCGHCSERWVVRCVSDEVPYYDDSEGLTLINKDELTALEQELATLKGGAV